MQVRLFEDYNKVKFAIGLSRSDVIPAGSFSVGFGQDLYPGLGMKIKYFRPRRSIMFIASAIEAVTGLYYKSIDFQGHWYLGHTGANVQSYSNYRDITSYGVIPDFHRIGETVYFNEGVTFEPNQNPSVSIWRFEMNLNIGGLAVALANNLTVSWYWSMVGDVET